MCVRCLTHITLRCWQLAACAVCQEDFELGEQAMGLVCRHWLDWTIIFEGVLKQTTAAITITLTNECV